jgi:lipooligosaccharide transport system ATP-binding protein
MPRTTTPPALGEDAGSLVVAEGLTKRFGDFVAVDGIDFRIGRGESYGFLGPNGAGKTSTMRMISCMSPVSDGILRVLGMDPARDGARIRSRIGLVPQEDSLDLELTVLDNLMVYGRYFDLPRKVIRERADQLLEFTQLTERAHDKVDPLSGGMKRRLTIARSLVTRPKLLMLDEPFSGVDPIAVYDVQQLVVNLRQSGLAILITDHNVRETLSIVDRAYLIDEGQVVSEGTKDFLINDPISRQLYLGERFQM